MSELSKSSASQQDVRYRLSSFSAGADVVRDIRDSSAEEEFTEADFLGAHLHEDGALSLDQSVMELKDLFGWPWCMTEGGSASRF